MYTLFKLSRRNVYASPIEPKSLQGGIVVTSGMTCGCICCYKKIPKLYARKSRKKISCLNDVKESVKTMYKHTIDQLSPSDRKRIYGMIAGRIGYLCYAVVSRMGSEPSKIVIVWARNQSLLDETITALGQESAATTGKMVFITENTCL